MKLPNTDRAIVPVAKLRDYSLDPTHPEGKHKARVFRSALGFTVDDYERLRQMILDALEVNEATEQSSNAFGRRFVVDFDTPGLRGTVTIRTTWIIRNDEVSPRLTSCFIH